MNGLIDQAITNVQMPVSNSRLCVVSAEKDRRSLKTLRSRAAQLRLQAMRSQLTAATNFCLAAENALIVGRLRLVGDAVERAKHTVQQVRAHLEEPNHIPADSVAGIRDRLVELEKQISDLEAGLQS